MNPFDQLPLWGVLLGSVLSMVLFIEIGFKLGSSTKGKTVKAQTAQVRAIMGASLGLLAFMLAFSFSMAQQHFETRTQAYMLEITAIDSAYRGADLLEDSSRSAAKDLLKQFVKLRLDIAKAVQESDMKRAIELVRESERIHNMLWSIAESAMETEGGGNDTGIFTQSALGMINAHDARLQAGLFNRISPVIWITLFIMALLSMIVMGYQAGLTGARSHIATWTLAMTFSVVIALVTDLDRPSSTLFKMNQQLMLELNDKLSGNEGNEGNGYGLYPQQ
jgi:hypothetical protein